MQPSESFTGTIFGGMGHLLYDYLVSNNQPIPAKIRTIQNLERFEFSLWSEILSDLNTKQKCPALGLEISKYTQAKHLGVLGYIATVCDTLGEAMERYQNLHRLVFDGTPLEVEIINQTVAISWALVPMSLMTLVTDEIAMGAMITHLGQCLGAKTVNLNGVHFAHPAPKNIAIYEDFFKCRVAFNQKKTQVFFPLQEMLRPLQHSDKTLQNILIQQADALLERLPNRASKVDYHIQKVILNGLQRGQFQIEHIADQMHLSVRQLQRVLQQQGTSFQQRVQSIRHMMAEQYLKDPHLSLQEIALLLGYSEQSAFQRAFKQWTQLTPQQWRQNNHEDIFLLKSNVSIHHLSFEI
jgi:AraC-like DNA-binding protein